MQSGSTITRTRGAALRNKISWAYMRDKVLEGTRTVRQCLEGQEESTLSSEAQASRGGRNQDWERKVCSHLKVRLIAVKF